jgi:GNAT superfamily N-acetyltransferase
MTTSDRFAGSLEGGLRFETCVGRSTDIYQQLDSPNWAPWLLVGPPVIEKQAEIFPEGQVIVCDERSKLAGTLSTNRIYWDGQLDTLPTWQGIAGSAGSYVDTYVPHGNALILMSVCIRSDAQGQGIADMLIDWAKRLAIAEGVEYLMGDFRPSEYGKFKLLGSDPGFAAYCQLKRHNDRLPADKWLRALTRKGMQVLRVDPKAVVVVTSFAEFEAYRRDYRASMWRRVTDSETIARKFKEHSPQAEVGSSIEVWECGETGTWYVNPDEDKAAYIESNLWGMLTIN